MYDNSFFLCASLSLFINFQITEKQLLQSESFRLWTNSLFFFPIEKSVSLQIPAKVEIQAGLSQPSVSRKVSTLQVEEQQLSNLSWQCEELIDGLCHSTDSLQSGYHPRPNSSYKGLEVPTSWH